MLTLHHTMVIVNGGRFRDEIVAHLRFVCHEISLQGQGADSTPWWTVQRSDSSSFISSASIATLSHATPSPVQPRKRPIDPPSYSAQLIQGSHSLHNTLHMPQQYCRENLHSESTGQHSRFRKLPNIVGAEVRSSCVC